MGSGPVGGLATAQVLLIGTGTHERESRLPDVPAVGGTLADLAVVLVERCGVPQEQVRLIVDPATPVEFGQVLQAVTERANDVLLVCYVGHGLLNERGRLHLATCGSGGSGRLEYTAWPYESLRDFVADSPARSKIVILDCCFSGRATGTLTAPEDVSGVSEIAGAYVLTSAGRDEFALAPQNARHTAFMGELIRLLSHGDSAAREHLTLNEVYRTLTRRIRAAGLPVPRRRTTGSVGDLVLTRNLAYRPPRGGQSSPKMPVAASSSVCPYPGLVSFGGQDSAWFFGRERLTRELIQIATERCDEGLPLLVTGVSGSGKSSLLHAGLLPAIARGELGVAGSAGWTRVAVTPSRLGDVISQGISAAGGTVFVVDQFEEIFTGLDRDKRHQVVRELRAAAERPASLVVLGMRADYLGRCADYPELGPVLARPVVIGPMTEREIRAAVEQPARAVGLAVESALTDVLLNDLGVRRGPDGEAYEAGRLPLLSHALRATWQNREGGELTVAAYTGIGGIRGALAATADRVLADLEEEPARRLLLRLVRVSQDAQDARRRVSLDQLRSEFPEPGQVDAILGALAADEARLVTLDEDSAELTHEALLHGWPRLRVWIEQDRAGLLIEQHLHDAAHAWNADGGDPAGLYRGQRLEVARQWAATHQDRLGSRTRDFLTAATAQEETEREAERRRARFRTRSLLAVTTLLLVALGLGGTAEYLRRDVAARSDSAQASNLAARAAALRSVDPAMAMRLSLAAAAVEDNSDTYAALAGSAAQPELSVSALTSRIATYPIYSLNGAVVALPVEGGAEIWDVATGKRRAVLSTQQPINGSNNFALSPDGSLALIGHEIVSTTSGTSQGRSDGSPDAFTAGVAVIDETTRRLPDLTPIAWVPGADPFAIRGDLIAVLSADGALDLYRNGRHLRHVASEDLTGSDAFKVAISPNGRWVVIAGSTKVARVDLRSGKSRRASLAVWGDDDRLNTQAFTADSTMMATSTELSDTVRLWNLKTMKEIRRFRYPGFRPNMLAFGAGDRTLTMGGSDATIRVLDVAAYTHQMKLAGAPFAAALISPDGMRVATLSADAVRLWDRRTGRSLGMSPGPWPTEWHDIPSTTVTVPAMAFSPDSTTLVVPRSGEAVALINAAHPRKVTTFPLRGFEKGRDILALTFSPDGGVLAAADSAGRVGLWDRKHPVSPGEIKNLSVPVSTLNWSSGILAGGTFLRTSAVGVHAPDSDRDVLAIDHTGRRFVLRGDNDSGAGNGYPNDTTLIIWDTRAGRRTSPPLSGHTGATVAAAFSPRDDLIATAAQDHTARLWNPETHMQFGVPYTEHASDVIAVAFTPDGSVLSTVSDDGVLVNRRIDRAALVSAVCARVQRGFTPQEWAQQVPDATYRRTC
ncbi:caspase, EACC1-associated type [Nonomuraea sp. NPDC003707]